MDVIQSSNKQVDKFGPGLHGFSPGNPGLGQPATYLSDAWCDGVQQEIINTIIAAGLTRSSANLSQMSTAIGLLIRRGSAMVGIATRTGTDVYTADLTPDLTALADGVRLNLRATAANTTTTPTLTVDALAAKIIVRSNNQPLQIGDIAGSGYWLQLIFDAANDRWVLLNPAFGIDMTPAGTVISFAASTAPAGYVKANGAAISRATFAALFAAIGTTFGVGNGSTTFNIPELRGEFVRGWDDGRGIDSGRALGSAQLDALQGHIHNLLNDSSATNVNTSNIARATGDNSVNVITTPARISTPVSDGANGTPRTAAETRGRNVALLYCIKF